MPPPLGDHFPEEFRRQFADHHLQIGTVIRARVADTNPPKIKRFVIVGVSADKLALGTLYINSEINPNIFPTEELKRLHLRLEATGRTYLEHDSYLDCSRIYEKDHEAILEVLKTDTGSVLGQLAPDDLARLKQTVKAARTIAIRVKKKFGLFY